MNPAVQLIRYLNSQGFIKEVPPEKALSNSSIGPLQLLEQMGIATEEDSLRFLSEDLSIEICNLEEESSKDGWQANELITEVSPKICWQNMCIPFKEKNGTVYVATCNPIDGTARQLFEFIFQHEIKFLLASESQIRQFLKKDSSGSLDDYDSFSDIEDSSSIELINPKKSQEVSDQSLESAPIIRLCNKIISDAIAYNASDIHLEPNENGLEVRFRIHGTMTSIFQIPKRLRPYVTTRFKVLSNMDISERRRPQDGRARARIAGEPTDIRVSSVPTAHGEKLVLRLLSRKSYTKSFESLGMPDSISRQFIQDLSQKGKMILVTGPTGSGKSTTLYTSLQHLQDGTLNIETVEDPIEFRMKGINQIQVHEASGVTFTSALRSILRQDPDVIMIGEIRDMDTATIAVQAAHTGHLVLSTLHTNDAISAISRLTQLGCAPYLIASSLAGVMAQRLVRVVCENCKTKLDSRQKEAVQFQLEQTGAPVSIDDLVTGSGCNKCFNTGFEGRMGIYSYMHMTIELEACIAANASMEQIRSKAQKAGFVDLGTSALELLRAERITFQEALPYLLIEKDSEPVQKATSNQIKKVVVQHEVQTKRTSSPTVNKSNPNAVLQKRKLLLIEDDEGVRSVLSMLLQKEMYEVVEATNGEEGLAAVYEHNPHIILCDLMMPVMDGRDFLIRMKKNNDTNHIPVIMLTAADNESNEIDLLELGADDFVSKASTSNVMLSRIRKACTGI